ncbi:VOC family protein [Brevibacillus daliensis]|uniref:VOC family protein n=1 Tax=Brevibacillus daliensis TaxID=2892995 RepID=UPI001E3C8C0E|nr:VOC family protein [Brevibacillus daliensis]
MEFNRLIPELYVSDFEKSLSFYTGVLGFSISFQRTEQSFAFLSLEGSQIMIMQYNPSGTWNTGALEYPYGRGINLAFQIDNLDSIIQSLSNFNFPIKHGPKENRYRMGEAMLHNKEVLILDPDGYLLRFLQHLGVKKMNE